MIKTFLLLLFTISVSVTNSQTYFLKITTGPFSTTTNASNRCALGDYDNDGWLDIVVSTYNDNCVTCTYPLLLFHNIGGSNTFERVLTAPIATITSRTFGVCWGDYDNDGKLDLFVCSEFGVNNLLFHNEGNGNFTQITIGAIVNNGGSSEAAAWGDYDRDGWIDLFVANNYGENNFLYHNNGNGTFTRITTGSIVNDGGASRGCSWGDYDNDKWLDLIVVNYQSGENDFLYHNNGNGTFTKITSGPPVTDGLWGSGCCWGDYDNDGYLDLFVTNNNSHCQLYHNNGNGSFSTVSGGPSTESGLCYGCSWGDYDADGYLDLFVAKQGSYNTLYKNNNGANFTKITNETPTQEGGNSVAGAWGDYTGDRKLDLFVTNNFLNSVNFLYQNIGTSGNQILLKLKGCLTPTGRSNTSGIGTRIKIRKGSQTFIREVCGGMGMGSQDMIWQHIGLGNITIIDSIIVYWPSGNIQKLTNVAANQTLLIDECLLGIESEVIPVKFELNQNYPNPFNPTTTIEYSIEKAGNVKLTIYNIFGQEIKILLNGFKGPGTFMETFDGTNLPSGVYIYKLETDDFTDTKKMILIK